MSSCKRFHSVRWKCRQSVCESDLALKRKIIPSDLLGLVSRRGSFVAAAQVGSGRLSVGANVGDCGSVTKVLSEELLVLTKGDILGLIHLVDPDSRETANQRKVVKDDMARVRLGAVPARTVQPTVTTYNERNLKWDAKN